MAGECLERCIRLAVRHVHLLLQRHHHISQLIQTKKLSVPLFIICHTNEKFRFYQFSLPFPLIFTFIFPFICHFPKILLLLYIIQPRVLDLFLDLDPKHLCSTLHILIASRKLMSTYSQFPFQLRQTLPNSLIYQFISL